MDEENDAIGFDVQSMHAQRATTQFCEKPPFMAIQYSIDDRRDTSSANTIFLLGRVVAQLYCFRCPLKRLLIHQCLHECYDSAKEFTALCN
jgi:hypothetical protein